LNINEAEVEFRLMLNIQIALEIISVGVALVRFSLAKLQVL